MPPDSKRYLETTCKKSWLAVSIHLDYRVQKGPADCQTQQIMCHREDKGTKGQRVCHNILNCRCSSPVLYIIRDSKADPPSDMVADLPHTSNSTNLCSLPVHVCKHMCEYAHAHTHTPCFSASTTQYFHHHLLGIFLCSAVLGQGEHVPPHQGTL